MTPAVNILQAEKVGYTLHHYQHQANTPSYGSEAVEALQVSADLVFKTLVVSSASDNLYVAVLPVSAKLNLKALAKLLSEKKFELANPAKVQSVTGYVLGGVSPLGQKSPLPTIIDESALKHTYIYVSAGKRGLEIELAPAHLISLCRAQTARIAVYS